MAATTTGKQELTKNMCAKEFEALKTCFQSAVSLSVHPNKNEIKPPLHCLLIFIARKTLNLLLFRLQMKKAVK